MPSTSERSKKRLSAASRDGDAGPSSHRSSRREPSVTSSHSHRAASVAGSHKSSSSSSQPHRRKHEKSEKNSSTSTKPNNKSSKSKSGRKGKRHTAGDLARELRFWKWMATTDSSKPPGDRNPVEERRKRMFWALFGVTGLAIAAYWIGRNYWGRISAKSAGTLGRLAGRPAKNPGLVGRFVRN